MSKLFTSFKIGPLEIKNRTIRAAAFEGMCTKNGTSELLHNYHKSVAEGGIGMTTLAYASVTQNGLSFKNQLWLRDEIVPELRKITDDIHKHGAAASIQIGHCGNMSKRSVTKCLPISASNGLNIYSPTLHRAMTKREIEEMAKSFGNAVNIARKAGFDAVEIHAGHGYLISQFLSPYTNRRKDEFGGSLENRMRFMNMVLKEVMAAAKNDIAVLVKTNMRDGFKGGIEIEDAILIAKEIEKASVHAIILSGGFVSRAPMYVMRGAMPIKTLTHYMDSMMLKIGITLAGKIMVPTVPYKDLYFLEDALKFRAELKLPLVYVGGVCSREGAEKALESGFEFVSMARALVNDPHFVDKMKMDNNAKCDCTHSNYCIARMYSKEMACHKTINDLPKRLKCEIERYETK